MRTLLRFTVVFAAVAVTVAAAGPRGAAAQSPAPAASSAPAPAASSSPAPATSTSPGPAPSGPPATDAARLASARTEFLAWQAGSIDVARYIPLARTQFTPDAVRNIANTYLKPLGTLQKFALVGGGPYQGMTVYQYRATGASGAIDELISWDASGLIQLIFFRPPS